MQKIIKNLIKSSAIFLILTGLLYFLSAFILFKNEVNFDIYRYFSYASILIGAFVISLINKNEEKSFLNLLPVIVFILVLAIVFKAFNLNLLFILIAAIIVYFIVIFLSTGKVKSKKRNMNKIRRNYEKLRKK